MGSFTKTLIVDVNGNGDYETIKEAAWALRNTGGTIIVEQGVYDFEDEDDYPTNTYWKTTVYVPSNVTIIGGGNVVIRITRSDISAFKNANSSNTNIKISGFKIIYDEPNNVALARYIMYFENCSGCHLKNLTITSNNKPIANLQFAICFNGTMEGLSRNNIIEGCRIRDFGAVVYNQVLEIYQYLYGGGIYISASPAYPSSCFIIKNNIISKVGQTPIMVDNSNMITISCNIVFDIKTVATGILMSSINSVVKGNIVNNVGNEIETSHGYYSSAGKKIAVFGNIFTGNSGSGVHLRYHDVNELDTVYHSLTGNICNDNMLNGIHVQSGVGNSAFFGNQCNENHAVGLRIQREYEPTPPYGPLGEAPVNNCVVGNIAVNNLDVSGVDISVSEYDKQIVANNIGNLNL